MVDDIPKILRDYLNFNRSLNKSPNTIREYEYDLVNFLKYMKWYSLDNRKHIDINEVTIQDIDSRFLNAITLSDIYEYLSYLQTKFHDKPTTRARKVASIRSFSSICM